MIELTGQSDSRLGVRVAAPREVLLIVCAAVVMASLDLFIVNLALPSIARDLHQPNLAALSWIVNGYTIVYAALLVFLGRVAEGHRRDRAFLLGLALFTVASALCAAAPSVTALVAFRLIQAVGAALLTPTSLSLVLSAYEPERRHGAVRAWTAVGGVAAAFSPVLGGLLVVHSWRWVFVINVPIGLVTLVVGARRLPHVARADVERPDALGTVLATVAIGLVTLALVEGSSWGWGSTRVLASLAASALLLSGFVLHVARARRPLIAPDLFASRPFRGASIVAFFFSVAFGAMLLSIVLWEQDVWHWSAVLAGLAMAPGPAMVPLISFGVAGRLLRRWGSGPVMALGCASFALGLTWWSLTATLSPDYLTSILPGSLLNGLGVGLALPTMMATASSSLPPSAFSTGSGVVTMLRQTGIALGVALVIAVIGSAAGRPAVAAFDHAWRLAAVIGLVAAVASLTTLRRPVDPGPRPRAQSLLTD